MKGIRSLGKGAGVVLLVLILALALTFAAACGNDDDDDNDNDNEEPDVVNAAAITVTPMSVVMLYPEQTYPASWPGGTIKVVGSGGYLRCGQGYNESAQSFELYFDDQPIGSIVCYVNHCEVTLEIPANAASGVHTISVEGGSGINIQVDGQ